MKKIYFSHIFNLVYNKGTQTTEFIYTSGERLLKSSPNEEGINFISFKFDL